jgi:thymidylate kinase
LIHTEALGLPGSGKTTLIGNIHDHIPNMRTAMPFYEYPMRSFMGVLKGMAVSINAFRITNNYQVFKNSCQFFASIEIIKYWNFKGDNTCANYVLDQGPVFQLALLLKEGCIELKQTSEFLQIINQSFPSYFYLDQTIEVLWDRISKRSLHSGRGQECNSIEEFRLFVAGYDTAWLKLKEGGGNIQTLQVRRLSEKDMLTLLFEKLNYGS